ncbi:MAG: hypothetical protein FWE63_02180 [Bacteroidales bacterium]|nr:hypothetical protein [Bacteroidales bacterium]
MKQFIRYPKQLYKNCSCYVPVLEADEYKMLTAHPAKLFCNIRLWMAYKNGKIVGRIGGIINHRYNKLKNKKRIRFGWFDVDNDIEIAKALLKTVEDWGREEALLEISGPSRFSNMEKQGMLVEGFDVLTTLSSEYNYSYYPLFMNEFGYEKEEDYLQMRIEIKDIPEKIKTLNNAVAERYPIKTKQFKDKKELFNYAERFFKALNQSFGDIYNFIPLTDAEIAYLIKTNFSIANKDLVGILVDENDDVVGFSLSVPSLSQAFRKANGKLFPFGWYHIFKALKKNDTVDLYLTGVLPQWVNRGIHALYHHQMHQTYIDKGYKYAITTQQLESNHACRIWERYGGIVITRRRCYKKNL